MSRGTKRLLWSWLCLLIAGADAGWGIEPLPESWRFAVAGDSRNCGDVVMPAIARSVVAQQNLAFYWHLGDFRLLGRSAESGIDADVQAEYGGRLTLEEYRRIAWGDFIAHQVAPFGTLPVFLGIGNHELYKSQDPLLSERQNAERSRAELVTQFAYWLDAPPVRKARGGEGGALKTYYHWTERNVDFINLDNAEADEAFDEEQLRWLTGILNQDRTDPQVRSLVVGMHRALPNSLACGHSMNGDQDKPDVRGTLSGRIAYEKLAQWRKDTGKAVYVIASHSHFVMSDVFRTPYWQNRNEVLPGWIIGTAGAVRYPLPKPLPADIFAKAAVYGYLLVTAKPDGTMEFEFKDLRESDIPAEVVARYGKEFVHQCWEGNRDDKEHLPAATCNDP